MDRLHFKLERWMDYGPTIAAAFAARQEEMIHSPSSRNARSENVSNEEGDDMDSTNDVAALRKIILGCMRNARDAALVASQEHIGWTNPVSGEEAPYRGRYGEDAEFQREMGSRGGASGRGGAYHPAYPGGGTLVKAMNAKNSDLIHPPC